MRLRKESFHAADELIFHLKAVAEASFGVGVHVFGKKSDADGDPRAAEGLDRERVEVRRMNFESRRMKAAVRRSHFVTRHFPVGLEVGSADVPFPGLVGGHAAIGEDCQSEAETDRVNFGHALRRKVAAEVVHPSEIDISFGPHAKSMHTDAITHRAPSGCLRSAPHVADAPEPHRAPKSGSGLSHLRQLAADTHNSASTPQWFHFPYPAPTPCQPISSPFLLPRAHP